MSNKPTPTPVTPPARPAVVAPTEPIPRALVASMQAKYSAGVITAEFELQGLEQQVESKRRQIQEMRGAVSALTAMLNQPNPAPAPVAPNSEKK